MKEATPRNERGRSLRFAFVLLLLAFPLHATASDRPYKLRVVVNFAENRFLTPVFREQISRDIGDQLQFAFGPLAEIEMLQQHPLLADIQSKGLQQALDGWQELSDTQTHFLLIDYHAGRYVLRSRLHDGGTGLNNSAGKQVETGDRGQVSTIAARLIYDGLGVAGNVVSSGAGVEITLQAGSLGPLDPWVRPGDIFAVTRIVDDGEKQRSMPLTWAVVRVSSSPKQGVCRGEYFCRYKEDELVMGTPQVAGYRCLKLAAVKASLRLRFLDADSFRPLSGLQVHVGRRGFQDTVRELSTDLNGLAETPDLFEGLAFVKVLSAGKLCAQFPVTLVDAHTIVCRLKLDAQAETVGLLQYRRDEWLRRILDALLVTSARTNQLNGQLARSLELALKYARTALEALDRDLASLDAERSELQRAAGKQAVAGFDLAEGEARLQELRRRRTELADFIARLDTGIQEGKSEKTLISLKLLEQARLLEGEAAYDQAISLYEEFLKNNAGQSKVQEHVAKLKKAWQTKGAEHAQAREFLCQTWPGLDIAGMKANLDKAKQSLKICRDKGDALTPLKLLRANLLHVANLKKRLTALQRQDGQDNRAEARTIAEVAEGLRVLHEEATALVRQMNGKES